MGVFKDITGQRFSKLLALEPTEKRSSSNVIWKCLCDCGKEHLATSGNLQSGSMKSCGCSQHEWQENHISITPPLHEFLEGNLLGDGGIYITGRSTNARYQHGSKYELLINFYKNFFTNHGITTGNTHKQVTPLGTGYSFPTKNYVELTPYRYRWYPEGKKIVPSDLELTPDVLLWWYVGDGCCYSQYATSEIRLATNGFEEQYIDLLISKLKEKGVEAIKCKSHGFIIYIRASSTQRFFDYMAPLPKELESIYGYKWNYKVLQRG